MSTDFSTDPANAAYIESIFEQWCQHPGSVSDEWRRYFEQLSIPAARPISASADVAKTAEDLSAAQHNEKQVAVLQLINAYRFRGHRQANLDPLNLYERPGVPDLQPIYHGLEEEDMERLFNTGSLVGDDELKLGEILSFVQDTYCQSIGAEYMYMTSTQQKRWIQDRIETVRGRPSFSAGKKQETLRLLTAARKMEEFLHKKYVGQKRFSLEGGESLIPLLDEIVQRSGESGIKEVIIGMAHRGRLNVLVNIFGKHPKTLFGEFEGKIDVGDGSGDVKYHLGFSSDIQTPGGPIHLVLGFNPSHLEIINPVVEGSVRARQDRRVDRERKQVLPLLIHGDAAFAGQGVVMETLNLAGTRGYGTGGTVHVVVNNQIGFTTSEPLDSRSTLYCTDVAKLVQAPIFHVNGMDPEAVLLATQIALDFRMQFRKDVVIDLVCYRRHGHNEADEPMVTQPMMYRKIREQKSVHQLYGEQLVAEGTIDESGPKRYIDEYVAALEGTQVVSRPLVKDPPLDNIADWRPYIGTQWRAPAETAVPVGKVEAIGLRITELPEDFEAHRVVKRILAARHDMALGKRPMDWGFAEHLAFATLLHDGYGIRLSGQDCERGTFAHRHTVIHSQNARGIYKPLHHLFEGQPRLQVINSLLSEEAVLGFDYGYSTAEPESLVIWEAQFGDFTNGAQVVIDQFLSSSESKWGRFCGLVMLLPHGFEGQGPEHSSARLERFLQLCAEENMQVCIPSSPAQIFHLLRRQMRRPYRKPLVIMSPKSLLRHRLCTSTREELASGGFQTLIDDADEPKAKAVSRLVLCSGKVYYDIVEKRRELELQHVAVVHVEQLYPFPEDEVRAVLARYSNAKEICWAQEEPRNQGSWFFMLSQRHLAGCIAKDQKLVYAGRDYSAAPAVGYLNVHLSQQRGLVETALGLDQLKLVQKQSA